jgi:hypothetical protein
MKWTPLNIQFHKSQAWFPLFLVQLFVSKSSTFRIAVEQPTQILQLCGPLAGTHPPMSE